MKTTSIYLLRNKITGGIYIGQSHNPKRRLMEHKSHPKSPRYPNMKLHNAIRKYGIDAFEMKILEEVPVELKDQKEKYYIKKYNATSKENYNEKQGTNLLKGIDSNLIVEDYLNGLSASKIGAKYDVKHPQVINVLKRELGEDKYFELSKKHARPKKNIPIETIVDLIENQGKSKKETAMILGVCDSTIVRRYNKWKKEQNPNFKVNPHGLGAKKVDVNLILKTYSELQNVVKTAEITGYSKNTVRKYVNLNRISK